MGSPGPAPVRLLSQELWLPEHTGRFLDSISGERLYVLFCLALSAADIPPPYVLAGHSLGGIVARRFCTRYPEGFVVSPRPQDWLLPALPRVRAILLFAEAFP